MTKLLDSLCRITALPEACRRPFHWPDQPPSSPSKYEYRGPRSQQALLSDLGAVWPSPVSSLAMTCMARTDCVLKGAQRGRSHQIIDTPPLPPLRLPSFSLFFPRMEHSTFEYISLLSPTGRRSLLSCPGLPPKPSCSGEICGTDYARPAKYIHLTKGT